MKKLVMKEFQPDAEAEITDEKTGRVFKLTSKIPVAVARDMVAMANRAADLKTAKTISVEDYDLSINVVRKMLYIMNPKEAVDTFIESRSQDEITLITEFIGEFIKESHADKKKDSKS